MKKKIPLVLGVAAALMAVSTAGYSWNYATHAYIADKIGTFMPILKMNQVYGIMAPDIYNLEFSLMNDAVLRTGIPVQTGIQTRPCGNRAPKISIPAGVYPDGNRGRNDNRPKRSRNPNGGITASFSFPLPFAGITQTGSEGLPTLKAGTLSPMSSPSYIQIEFYLKIFTMSTEIDFYPQTINPLPAVNGFGKGMT